jgi:hypothetical protein
MAVDGAAPQHENPGSKNHSVGMPRAPVVASTQPANGTAMSADDPWAETPEKANQPAPRIPVCT